MRHTRLVYGSTVGTQFLPSVSMLLHGEKTEKHGEKYALALQEVKPNRRRVDMENKRFDSQRLIE